MSFNTVSDFRDNVQQRLHVDRYVLDGDVGDLAAPAAVRAASDAAPTYTVEATPVAEGVWFLSGSGGANSVLLEFADHLTLFEVPTNRAWTAALIAKARSTVPGKPVTEAITSHHHFDHPAGCGPRSPKASRSSRKRVTSPGSRSSRDGVEAFPDALSRNPRPLQTRAVDDHLRLSDSKLTVTCYTRRVQQPHGPRLDGVRPRASVVDPGRPVRFELGSLLWGNTYEDNVAHRKIDVERDVPDYHGRVLPLSEVRAKLAEQTRNAEQLCAGGETAINAGLSARVGRLTDDVSVPIGG